MNKLFSKLVMGLGALIVLSLGSTSVLADNLLIIPVAPRIVQPAGLGTVNTVLVLQTHGSSTSGFGSVAYNPNGNGANKKGDVVSGNQIVGGSNNQTYSVAQLGITGAADLCINMNINDPNK